MRRVESLESKRVSIQRALDDEKTQEERNRLGQFATPPALAREVVGQAVALLPEQSRIRFLDPGFGTGSFYSALRALVPARRIAAATGFELDPHYGEPAQELWAGARLTLRIEDFTAAVPAEDERANLVVCNPPYVRHHHLDGEMKARLRLASERSCGIQMNGLSGLYCYFIALSHQWMRPDGIGAWLVPSEFMGVNYGRALKQYLLGKVTLLQIHRFDPTDSQFSDALVSSAVVLVKNTPPPDDHTVTFSYGGTLAQPNLRRDVQKEVLEREPKWTRHPKASAPRYRSAVTLGDLFDVKRGLATGDNNFFIMSLDALRERKLPEACFTPILPPGRNIADDEIYADQQGRPLLDKQLFLLNVRLPEQEIAARYPALKAYLDTGKTGTNPVAERYLCRHRRPWYAQEVRPPAPIMCTYMGRAQSGRKPFRFLLNHSCATATNVYLMLYPKPHVAPVFDENPALLRAVWGFLNDLDPEDVVGHGRVYGGGLHKMEPQELRGVGFDALVADAPELVA